MSESAAEAQGADAAAVERAPAAAPKAKRGFFGRISGFFERIALFVRQVVAEMKKVTTPTRAELGKLVTVVLIFVAVFTAVVFVLDLGLGAAAAWLFG
ncbi:preprotein translocase subunit SecE [Flavimobilis sp. GY10621]|uniref:Protein translocase subunit SecE n=1 Tax=Flavimobilis rhizosphaerae TaxID=2775421 RepID=A0ABR9DNT2_9MICO|nr:preprotein translocase subunit SecE [Flavimobilis rhizosphaerae]MBD9698767.1 preprotein translocase subunit SecE [Flavimobilis rhizosphaerae]